MASITITTTNANWIEYFNGRTFDSGDDIAFSPTKMELFIENYRGEAGGQIKLWRNRKVIAELDHTEIVDRGGDLIRAFIEWEDTVDLSEFSIEDNEEDYSWNEFVAI